MQRIATVVPFYGVLSHTSGPLDEKLGFDRAKKPLAPLDAGRTLRCPLLGFFGAQDAIVPMSDVDALRSQLLASGQPAELRVFEGAGHAFMNETRPQMYRPEAAAQAWKELLAFLAQRLA